MTTRFLSLPEFFWLAEHVTGIDADVFDTPRSINPADSALHAPRSELRRTGLLPNAWIGAQSPRSRRCWRCRLRGCHDSQYAPAALTVRGHEGIARGQGLPVGRDLDVTMLGIPLTILGRVDVEMLPVESL